MPDFTTASAISLIMSSLTLQPNLFHEFHPMGGVSARLAEGEAFSCPNSPVLNKAATKIEATTRCRIFMHTLYQKYPEIDSCVLLSTQSKHPCRYRHYRRKCPAGCPISRAPFAREVGILVKA